MSIKKVFEECGSFLIIAHKGPDVDTAGAAAALAEALEQLGKRVTVTAEEPINGQVRRVLSRVNCELSPPDYAVDAIIVVDTNSPSHFDLDAVKGSKATKVLIDHHARKEKVLEHFDITMVDEEAISATQIVYRLLDEAGIKFTHDISLAIAAGMVTDSAGFSIATPEFFSILADVLVRGNVSFSEVLDTIKLPVEEPEKIARLKGAQRLKIIREKGHIIAFSRVNAFESSVAKSLIHLGADVAFVGSAKEGIARISARANRRTVEEGLHLGRDILPSIADLIGGDAGGHAGAAGANGVNEKAIDATIEICVQRTREFVRSADR